MDLSDFEGSWKIARVVKDALTGQTGRFRGVAVFRPDAEGLRYDETGLMVFGSGPELRAERSYLWRQAPQGINVFFSDGRFFHAIGSGQTPEDRHYCDPDIYDVTYDFSHWPQWSARWQVRGPRKDYVMVSDYRR